MKYKWQATSALGKHVRDKFCFRFGHTWFHEFFYLTNLFCCFSLRRIAKNQNYYPKPSLCCLKFLEKLSYFYLCTFALINQKSFIFLLFHYSSEFQVSFFELIYGFNEYDMTKNVLTRSRGTGMSKNLEGDILIWWA